jgi:hypothetical protein
LAASIVPASSRDAPVMGRRGEPITSAQLEDAVLRAETGFLRTRDLDLGKVVEIVHRVLVSLLSRPSVYGTSSETARNQPCVERSTTRTTRFCSSHAVRCTPSRRTRLPRGDVLLAERGHLPSRLRSPATVIIGRGIWDASGRRVSLTSTAAARGSRCGDGSRAATERMSTS